MWWTRWRRDTESYSQTDNKIVDMTLQNCLTNGFILGGQGNVVDDTTIFNIGRRRSRPPRAIGGQFFGPNATFSNSRVSNLYGGSPKASVFHFRVVSRTVQPSSTA